MRFELVTPELIQTRESLGLVKDIYDPASTVREPLSEYRTMLDLIHRDGTLATAYDIVVDFATHRGFDFIGGDKEKRDELRELFENLNFKQVLHNLMYSLCYYGDGYLELRRNQSATPNELWVLEATEMRILYDSHGKVDGYVQRPFNMSGMSEKDIRAKEGTPEHPMQGIFFSPDEVIYFRMKWIGSQVYSYNPNTPIATEASTKLYAGNYLMNIFINMPPRYVAHLAGISKKDYESAKKEFQSTKTNYKKTIAFSRSSDPKSKMDLKKIEAPYDETLINIIKWLNNEIIKVTRVPRLWLEESRSENRSAAEVEQRPFDVRIQSIHRTMLEPSINTKLLKALGYYKKKEGKSKLRIKFNEISRKGEKEIIANAGMLRNMGLKPKALVTYLDERGILGLDPTDFEKQQIKKDMELNESRARMDKGTEDIKSRLDEKGVSAGSELKMKEEGKL